MLFECWAEPIHGGKKSDLKLKLQEKPVPGSTVGIVTTLWGLGFEV